MRIPRARRAGGRRREVARAPAAGHSLEPLPEVTGSGPRHVRLVELVLQGFGRFGAPVRLSLQPGCNVLVRPNEWGKSTAVAGLLGAWFGLGGGQGSARAGRRAAAIGGRELYRNWHGHDTFAARVLFDVDERRYALYRDFDSYRVALWSTAVDPQTGQPVAPARWPMLPEGEGAAPGWSLHFHAEHNPQGTHAAHAFDEVLQRLLGVRSATLYQAVFAVTQRIPEAEALDSELQVWIAGAGTVGVPQALAWLVERAKDLTQRTGELGLTGRNLELPRRREQLLERIARLQQQAAEHAGRLGELHALSEAIRRHRADVEAFQQQQQQLARRLGVWEKWLEHRRRRQERLQHLLQLEQAVEAVERMLAQQAALQARREREMGPFDAAAAALGNRDLAHAVAEWAALRGQLEEAGNRWKQLDAEQAGRAREMETLQAALARDFPELAGRGAPACRAAAAAHRELRQRLEEMRAIDARLGALATREREAIQVLQRLDRWARWAPAPVAALKRLKETAGRLVAAWEAVVAAAERVEDLRRKLREAYGPLEEAPADLVELLRYFPHHLRDRDAAVERARSVLDGLQAQQRAAEEAAHALEERYADVLRLQEALLPVAGDVERATRWLDALLQAAGVVAELEREQEALDRLADRLRLGRWRAGLRAAVAGLLAGAVAGLLLQALAGAGEDPWLAAGAGAAVGGALAALAGWVAAWARGRRATGQTARKAQLADRLQSARTALEDQLRPLGSQLAGSLQAAAGSIDVARVTALRERWLAAAREQERVRQSVPPPQAIEEATAALQRAEAERDAFLDRTGPARAAFGDDVVGAVSRWTALREELRGHERELRVRLGPLVAPGAVAPSTPLGPLDELRALPVASEWAVLQELLAEPAPPAVGALVEAVLRLDEPFWNAALDEANHWERAYREQQQVARDRQALLEPGPDGVSRPQWLQARLEALRAEAAPFTDGQTPEEVAARLDAFSERQGHLEALQRVYQEQRAAFEELARQIDGLQRRLHDAEHPLLPLLQAYAGDPEAVRAGLAAYLEVLKGIQDAAGAVVAICSAHQAADPGALRLRAVSQRELVAAETREMEQLRAEEPALPAPDDARGLEQLAEAIERLKTQKEEVEHQAAAAGEREIETRRKQAALVGPSAVNIAAAEVELAECRQELQQVEESIAAIRAAYEHLLEASRQFHAAHRARLEEAASQWLSRFTRTPGRRVAFDEAFRIEVVDPDGHRYPPARLSQGARDQLYLALRLAIAHLMAPDVRLPFIFDDPFLNCDAHRLDAIAEAIREMTSDWQVLILTHREDLAPWGAPVPVQEG